MIIILTQWQSEGRGLILKYLFLHILKTPSCCKLLWWIICPSLVTDHQTFTSKVSGGFLINSQKMTQLPLFCLLFFHFGWISMWFFIWNVFLCFHFIGCHTIYQFFSVMPSFLRFFKKAFLPESEPSIKNQCRNRAVPRHAFVHISTNSPNPCLPFVAENKYICSQKQIYLFT